MAFKLTIGMAVAGDLHGPIYTIQQIRISHPEILDVTEFVVIDNAPEAADDKNQLKQFCRGIPNCRYVPYTEIKGTAAPRNRVFAEAQGDYVMCVDSHIMLPPGVLKRFIAYMDARGPECKDLIQGPLWYDQLNPNHVETHMAPYMYDAGPNFTMPVGILDDGSKLTNPRLAWRGEMFGIWCGDKRGQNPENPPFKIPMQGLGLFACRRDKWVGFNENFRGFGGEEGYIHQKFRMLGGDCICLPFLRWWHCFWRKDNVIPYRCDKLDKLRNYMIVATELGISDAPAVKHFCEEIDGPIPKWMADKTREEVKALGIVPIQRVVPAKPATAKPDVIPPLVSCVCVTYGRVTLLADVVSCFASQDYPNREMVIYNTHQTPIVAGSDWPASVRIINAPSDLKSLGEIRALALAEAKGDIVQHWDDDDWYLPWHVSAGVAGLVGFNGPGPRAWKPEEHWFDLQGVGLSLERNVVECSATYWKQAIVDNGGYTTDCQAGAEQLGFIQSLQKANQYARKSMGPWNPYVYRWGQPGVSHISATRQGESWQDSVKRWREVNRDAGDGTTPLKLGAGVDTERMSAFVDKDYRDEWLAKARGVMAIGDRPQVSDDDKISQLLLQSVAGRNDAVICEVGSDQTVKFVGNTGVRAVYSIGPKGSPNAADRLKVSAEILECTTCQFGSDKIDVLYLANDNPVLNLLLLRKLAPIFSPTCSIAVESSASQLVWAMLAPTHRHARVGSMDVFTPRALPRWLQFLPMGI